MSTNEFHLPHLNTFYSPGKQSVPRQPRNEAVDSANSATADQHHDDLDPINQAASKEAETVSGVERTNNPARPDSSVTTTSKKHHWNSAGDRCVPNHRFSMSLTVACSAVPPAV